MCDKKTDNKTGRLWIFLDVFINLWSRPMKWNYDFALQFVYVVIYMYHKLTEK